jgi:hypothetical protein
MLMGERPRLSGRAKLDGFFVRGGNLRLHGWASTFDHPVQLALGSLRFHSVVSRSEAP